MAHSWRLPRRSPFGLLNASTLTAIGSTAAGAYDLTFGCTNNRLYTAPMTTGIGSTPVDPVNGLGSTTLISSASYNAIVATTDGAYVYGAATSPDSNGSYDINGFTVNADGTLTALVPPAAYASGTAATPGYLQLTSDGRVAANAVLTPNTTSLNLDAFNIASGGALSLDSSLPAVAGPVAVSPVAACPIFFGLYSRMCG
jgi:hypothetical protein